MPDEDILLFQAPSPVKSWHNIALSLPSCVSEVLAMLPLITLHLVQATAMVMPPAEMTFTVILWQWATTRTT